MSFSYFRNLSRKACSRKGSGDWRKGPTRILSLKGNWEVLQVRRNNAINQHKLGVNWEQNLAEKNLRVLADEKLTVS